MSENLLGITRVGAQAHAPAPYAQTIHNNVDLSELIKAIKDSQCNIHIPQAVADVELSPTIKVEPIEVKLDHFELIEAISKIKPQVNVTIEPVKVSPPIINIEHKHPLLWLVLLVQTLAAIAGVALYAAKNYG
jgi:hypothetical protein